MMIYLNVALHTDFPKELEEAFQNGNEDDMKAWALENLRRLVDGEETEQEFGAQLLSINVRGTND